MAISRMARLRHPGVLRDFNWAADLPTFGRYNLIYGWNGSGKTTISKMFRALETRTAPANSEVYAAGDDGCPYRHRRRVVWAKERLERDDFPVPFQNTIRSSLTLFAGSRTSEQPTRILAFSRQADLHSVAMHG